MDRHELLNQVRRLRGESKSIRAIAVELGVHRSRVHRALKVLSQKHEDKPVGPAGSLIGTTFVGRERELGELRAAFDDAVNGNGRLVMVVGEPGIGKTALCKELARYAQEQGGTTLVGHCYDEGSLSLPYLPFVQAMRSYVVSRSEDDLRADLGDSASHVARIMPEIRDKLGVEPDAPTDPEENRYRLLNGVTTLLTNVSKSRPLAIVLEDLHDADSGTLEMLTYLSGFLSDTNALVVGTYRDVEVDRAHPLSSALVELRRASAFSRVTLRGLGLEDVRRMMTDVSGESITERLAVTVHRQTEGNPLFVQEVARYLREEQVLATGDSEMELRVPEGVRDVIGKRLSRLSKECNQMLAVASVIGREFNLDILLEVSSLSEDDLYTHLEEAQGASVVEERSAVGAGVSFRFTHAFFRQTLYEETIAPRRIRLHQQVARALEARYQVRPEEHAVELAEHFSYSSDASDLAKAVHFGELAANRAMAVYAYSEAVGHLERALEVEDVLDQDDKARRCDLLLTLGEAMMPAGESLRVYESVAPEAFNLAETLGDNDRGARACQLAVEAMQRYSVGVMADKPEFRTWTERFDRVAAPGTKHRVLADLALSTVSRATRELGETYRLRKGAVKLARQLGDAELFVRAAQVFVYTDWAPQHQEERLALAREVADEYVTSAKADTGGLGTLGSVLLEMGERARAEESWGRLRARAYLTQDANLLMNALSKEGVIALLDGHLEEAVAVGERLASMGDKFGIDLGGQLENLRVSAVPLTLLGRTDEVLVSLEELSDPARTAGLLHQIQAWVLAEAGRVEDAVELSERYMAEGTYSEAEDETRSWALLIILETAVLVEDRETSRALYRRLSVLSDMALMLGQCVARILGGAAALLGNHDTARSHYMKALELMGAIRHRPELALTRLGLAELLLDHYPNERSEALEHLDFAVTELRDMKMQPALERALGLQAGLEARPVEKPAYPDGLTRREVEVLRLVASGKSNAEIASELVLSIRTVERHISNIYGKTRSGGRADATAFAFTKGLMSST